MTEQPGRKSPIVEHIVSPWICGTPTKGGLLALEHKQLFRELAEKYPEPESAQDGDLVLLFTKRIQWWDENRLDHFHETTVYHVVAKADWWREHPELAKAYLEISSRPPTIRQVRLPADDLVKPRHPIYESARCFELWPHFYTDQRILAISEERINRLLQLVDLGRDQGTHSVAFVRWEIGSGISPINTNRRALEELGIPFISLLCDGRAQE